MSEDLAKIESALSSVPASDRDTWLQVAMAINSELGDAGFSLWDSWSRSADCYNESDARATWKSLSPGGGINISTLFYIAYQNGWTSKGYTTPSDAEKAQHRANMEAERQKREAERTKVRAECRKKSAAIWKQSEPAPENHPYLMKKGIKAHGLRMLDGRLWVPVRDAAGKLHGLQYILPEKDQTGKDKFFVKGTPKTGHYYSFGGKPEMILALAEGFATAATIHEATGYPVAVAFDAGNLQPVAEVLREKFPDVQIVVCADNDTTTDGNPGLTKAKAAAAAIDGILAVPVFPDGSGGDFNDLAAATSIEEVKKQVTGAQPAEDKKTETNQNRVVLLNAADIMPRAIRWIWSGWLAAGKLHILAGAPGTGKSTLAFGLGASITTAGRWPDGTPADLGSVAIWSGEDDPADTIVPRLLACGANLENIKIISGMTGTDPRPFDPSTDMTDLRTSLHGQNIRLLIVDPVVSAVAGDSHKNTEVRRALQPLVDLAASIDCAVLGISHFTKSSAGKDPIDRVTGSLAFGALARVVMAAAKLPEDEHNGARLLARAKSNIGPDSGGVLYNLEQVAIPGHPDIMNTRVTWGKLIEGTARDLLAQAEQNDGEEKSATDEAREWLKDLLTSGAMEAGVVKSEARQAGITDKALRRAREKLGVKPEKKGFGGGWWWGLPTDHENTKMPPSCPTQKEGTFDAFGENTKMPHLFKDDQDALKNCWAPSGHLRENSKNIIREIV